MGVHKGGQEREREDRQRGKDRIGRGRSDAGEEPRLVGSAEGTLYADHPDRSERDRSQKTDQQAL